MNPLNAKQSKPLEGGASFPLKHRIFRLVWSLIWALLAAWTPPPMHRWRRLLLRIFGASVHPTARVYGGASIWYPPNLSIGANSVIGPGANIYCMGCITIGEKVVISQGAYLCGGTHDISDPYFQLITRPIEICSLAWVAAEAFIGPGVTVGRGAVIGARSVLFKNAEENGVYAGNPAQFIRYRY
ncbi:MAG: putative colanic acid biosynthesis acetyltransferase WcaF [Zhongshania sp.]|jgi:putative colanic acid biosynthesis acetyltransferase WcaF